MGQPINPYSAPQADQALDQPSSAEGARDASNGARFVNLLVDSFAMFVVVAVADVLTDMMGAAESDANFIGWAVMLAYYLGFEGVLSATPGKLLTRTRVVRLDGSKAGLLQIFARTACRFIPFEPISFLSNGGMRGWHDSLSRTRVVYRS